MLERSRQAPRWKRHPCRAPATLRAILLAQEDEVDAETEGESDPPANPLSVVSKQVAREGNIGREQKTDCQVLQINGENQYPNQAHPMAYCLMPLPLQSLWRAL